MLPAPDTPPVKPVPVGALHAYVVPVGITAAVGVYVNGIAEQVLVLCAEIVAIGLTVTVNVNTEPTHEPEAGVTVYKAVSAFGELLTKLSTRTGMLVSAPPALKTSSPTVGEPQEYTVPEGTEPVGV